MIYPGKMLQFIKSTTTTLPYSLCLLLLACSKPAVIETTTSFYQWQTKWSFTPETFTYLNAIEAKKLYVKFFDVDWNFNKQQAIPLAPLMWEAQNWASFELVPTVFITNRTLQQLSSSDLTTLAQNIHRKIISVAQNTPFQELQFDCDWSESTQGKYFLLLQHLKNLFPEQQFSATIRLHQIKYAQQTGIPPVDRGMLMFYNMGELSNWETSNSILDLEVAQQYLNKLKIYPLPLDVALPLFQWGAVFRDGKLFKLINQLELKELVDQERFKEIQSYKYRVVQSTYLHGHYLYVGDQIRLEIVTQKTLLEAAQLLQTHLKKLDRTIVFYHLGTRQMERFDSTTIKNIVGQFD